MEFEKLPKDIQEEVSALKHGARTIEAGVELALQNAENLEDFREAISTDMEKLVEEARGVADLLGSVKEASCTGDRAKWYVNVDITKQACFTVEADNIKEAEEKARNFDTLEEETEDEKVVSVEEIKKA